MRIIIAGGRKFDDPKLLKEKCDHHLSLIPKDQIEIVSGCQVTIDLDTGRKYGADYLGEQYALQNDYTLHRFPADWDNLGKGAGPIRNKKMAEFADALIAFWDGKSSGTKNMISQMKSLNKIVKIVSYE